MVCDSASTWFSQPDTGRSQRHVASAHSPATRLSATTPPPTVRWASSTGIDYPASRPPEEAHMLAAGDPAPDFALTADDGSTVRLGDLRGQRVVLYFYPKDDTPGCTKQACDLRDRFADFGDARVFGISRDDSASHVRFREKYGLPFPL